MARFCESPMRFPHLFPVIYPEIAAVAREARLHFLFDPATPSKSSAWSRRCSVHLMKNGQQLAGDRGVAEFVQQQRLSHGRRVIDEAGKTLRRPVTRRAG